MKTFTSVVVLLAASATYVVSMPAIERPGGVLAVRAPVEQRTLLFQTLYTNTKGSN
jgi:hypothetical protein